jgi:hypothetical protein
MSAPEDIAAFMAKINSVDGTGTVAMVDPDTEPNKNILITRLSHAIIELLGAGANPPTAAELPAAKTAYITGLTAALTALYGNGNRTLAVDDAVFGGGSRSSRQTRRRRNGGKRNQRR